jgi:hypothetical protein
MTQDIAATPAAARADRRADGPGRTARAVLVAVVALPVVVAVVRALATDWFPIGDNALLYIRTADVLTQHHPFLGSWTSASISVGENMNNPGPTYDFLIAPFAHLFSPGPGAAIGVGTVNIVSIIAISAAARHIGGWAMQRWFLLATAGLAWAMGSELLIDIWQAHALLLPFLLFLVLLLGCTAGRVTLLPAAAGVGTLLIHTHISYAYILSMLIATALVTAWWQHRSVEWRSIPAALRHRTAAATAIVLAALWVHPLWEQLFGEGRGNLTRLVTNSSGGDVTLGLRNATKITAAVFSLPWWWTRPGFSTTVPDIALATSPDGPELVVFGLPRGATAVLAMVLLAGVLAALTALAHRRRRRLETSAGVLATVAVPATAIALSLLTIGPVGLMVHHVRWAWTLSVFVTAVLLWLAVHVWSGRRASGESPLVTPVVIGLIVLLAALSLPYRAHPEGPVADYDSMPAMRRVFPAVGVLEGYDPVVFRTDNINVFEPYSSTMMMRMQELGIEFRVEDEPMVRQLGNNRRADGSETVTVFQLEGSPALLYDGPACTIALASALTEGDEAEVRDTADALAEALTAGGISVDDTALAADEPFELLDAARAGDIGAAWALVVDGALARWVAEGAATSADPGLASDIGSVMDWMLSTYGLFAEGIAPCP